jgi:uncharacterized membrane protein YqiK
MTPKPRVRQLAAWQQARDHVQHPILLIRRKDPKRAEALAQACPRTVQPHADGNRGMAEAACDRARREAINVVKEHRLALARRQLGERLANEDE